ncbi:hypothetical protein DL98DRAFT_591014 [Cadophora sp. DSE1049]|nr:hypothetical protein DL98DRAFT_591014 [Cadophora sp. DSE1049]
MDDASSSREKREQNKRDREQREKEQRERDAVSTFHPNLLPCRADGNIKFIHGGYNLGQKLIFNDMTTWLVRFAQVGSVCDTLADKKVAMEVETPSRIHEETDVPVPRIHGWGLATHNPLGLGHFIIMDFIEGVSLESILKEKADKRLIRDDIGDSDIEYIYRHNLPTPRTGFQAPIRPLTFKVIETKGLRRQPSISYTSFSQDWEQLVHQSNSVASEYDARAKLSSFNALRALIPDFVRKNYDKGPFKLLCDDFGLANMIVRSKDNLTIVGLLQSRLTLYDAEFKKEAAQSAAILTQYLRYLEIFKRILKKEKEQLPGHQSKKLSSLVEWSQASSTMWLHMILQTGFNYISSVPFAQLKKHIGTGKWEKVQNEFLGTEAIKALITKRTIQLDQYNEALEQIRDLKYKVDNGDITEEEFIKAITTLC